MPVTDDHTCALCLLDGLSAQVAGAAITIFLGTAVCKDHLEMVANAPGMASQPVLRYRRVMARRGGRPPQP